MNAELERRWRQGEPPFDGPVPMLDGDVTTDDGVLAAVRLAIGLLQPVHPAGPLYVNEDWHSHDGFIKSERATSWAEAGAWVRDVEHLRASCSEDTHVHTLLFPGDFAFCLRYWLGGEEGNFFDLCARWDVLKRLAASLEAMGVRAVIEPSAKVHFDRRYAG